VCHQLEESDYTNNVAEVTVDIPDIGEERIRTDGRHTGTNTEDDEHGEEDQA